MNIIAVVVLYQCRPDQSPTIATLVRSWAQSPAQAMELKLIVYDNSPESQPMSVPLPFDHQYVHDAANGGLAAAYNYALGSDPGGRHQWLLLLDQDSSLPDDFVALTAGALTAIDQDQGVAAVVPQVLHQDGRPVSPARLQWGWNIWPMTIPAGSICRKPITAINSGTLLRKSFMEEIGGFNPLFKLDYLDHWLFAEIYRRGKTACVSGAVVVHDLSIRQSFQTVSEERYQSILDAETLFYRTCLKHSKLKYHLIALTYRAAKQGLSGKRQLGRLTARHLCQIVTNR